MSFCTYFFFNSWSALSTSNRHPQLGMLCQRQCMDALSPGLSIKSTLHWHTRYARARSRWNCTQTILVWLSSACCLFFNELELPLVDIILKVNTKALVMFHALMYTLRWTIHKWDPPAKRQQHHTLEFFIFNSIFFFFSFFCNVYLFLSCF